VHRGFSQSLYNSFLILSPYLPSSQVDALTARRDLFTDLRSTLPPASVLPGGEPHPPVLTPEVTPEEVAERIAVLHSFGSVEATFALAQV
jgi:hypothetical protein